MLQKAPLSLILLIIGTCSRKSQAALGGETCTVPAVGSGAGASAQCTSTENGFCLIDQLTVTGANPVTGVTSAGKCVCYYGYSGPKCATKTSTTSSKSNSGTLLSAAALSALAAYYLSQHSNKDSYYYNKY